MPNLSPKQLDIFNAFNVRYLLVSGPRRSGKTLGCAHKIARHCFDTPKGKCRVAIFAKLLKQAQEGGVWTDLTEIVIPEWQAQGFLKYLRPPKVDGQTRTMYFDVQARDGGASRVMLNSLQHDSDAETVLRSRRFSMIFFSELSLFEDRNVFTTATESLRVPGLPYNRHSFMADCNPAPDGEDSWIYDTWWRQRMMEGFPEGCETPEQQEQWRQYQSELGLIEVMITDNPYLSKEEIASLIYKYRAMGPDVYARMIEGKWVRASAEGFFANIFNPDIHVIGNVKSPAKDEWECLLPQENTDTIYTSFDLGDRNSSVIFADKARDGNGNSIWYGIDEAIILDKQIDLADYVELVISMMEKWEKFLGRKLIWRHWSDNSSFRHKLAASATEHMMVQKFSNGLIRMNAAPKYAGCVKDGISIMRRLFFENRLYFSAHMKHSIEMASGLSPQRKKGSDDLLSSVKLVRDGDPLGHAFASWRYLLTAEEPASIVRSIGPRAGHVKPRILSLA